MLLSLLPMLLPALPLPLLKLQPVLLLPQGLPLLQGLLLLPPSKHLPRQRNRSLQASRS
jgi:hypothetical protein